MDIYAVTGKPVAHSLSPQLFNHAFLKGGIEAAYTRLAAESAEEALKMSRQIGLRGLNVTAPFKEEMAALMDSLEFDVREIGAVNGVVFSGGRALGFNTDPQGAIGAFVHSGVELRGKDVAVLGAGGAARAAVYGLIKAEAKVRVVNRTFSKAAEIARKFGCQAESFERLPEVIGRADIVLSAVSNSDSLVRPEWLVPGQVVLDANYRDSRLSEIARIQGCRVVSGLDWLVFQAIAAFEILAGRPITYEDLKGGLSSPPTHGASGPSLSLVGMMGTGKTTVGKKLAAELGLEVIDTDEAIEEEAGVPISSVFEKYGEKYFRALENRMIRRISGETQRRIYSLGGGAVSNPENRNIIKSHSFVIWLWADPKQILTRITGNGRPLLNAADRHEQLTELISGRLADYARASDLIINTGSSPEDTVRKIIDEIH